MSNKQLHRVLVSILRTLRYSESARFSELMMPTGLESDTFKFYLRDLVKHGYVEKLESGSYRLTPNGKEFANSLNEAQRLIQKQPKISVLIVATMDRPAGEPLYLLQKRARHPFHGFWSEVHGRSEWSEPFEETASRQLTRQTGLKAEFRVHSFHRVRDYHSEKGDLLEDKLFVVVKAKNVTGEIVNKYGGGFNAWLTLEELQHQDKVFPSTLATIKEIDDSSFYRADDYTYTPGEY